MRALIVTLVALAALMIPTAALATHQEPPKPPPFAGTTFTINGACVTSSNILQDAFLKLAVKFKFKVSTDEVFGPLAPYGFADRDADDSYVTLGCTAAAAPQISSSFVCQSADNREVPSLQLAPNAATMLKSGWHNPVAVPGADKAVAGPYDAVSHPTVIGSVKAPWTLHCGGTATVGFVDFFGDLFGSGAAKPTDPGMYPIGIG